MAGPRLDALLGMDPAKEGSKEMMGGEDNKGGGYDADARRLKTALESGDGDTMYSIIKGILQDIEDEGPEPGPSQPGKPGGFPVGV